MTKTARQIRKTSVTLAITLALSLPMAAQAGSFKLPTNNAAGWARAGAGGSLWANDPTASYNNPSAMAFFNGSALQITATGIRPTAKFSGEFRDQSGAPVTGDNPDGFGKFQPFPNIGLVLPVNDRFALGAAITVPYGLVSEYDPTWQGRYFGTKTKVKSVALTVSAGFKVSDNFSLGLGLVGQRTEAQLNTVLDPNGAAAALFGLPLPPQQNDVRLNVNVDKNYAFGYIASATWKPSSRDSLSVSYHSRISNNLTGDYRLYGSDAGKNLLALAHTLDPTLPAINPDGGNASARLDMPAFASINWLHDYDSGFKLGASFRWIHWSHFQRLTLKSDGEQLVSLPQNYSNGWVASIGGEYPVTEKWTLRGGVGYDKTPSSITSRDPRIPDGTRKLLGLGVGYQASRNFSIDLGYQHQFVGDTRVHLKNQPLLGAGTMDGKFNDSGDVVSLTGTFKF